MWFRPSGTTFGLTQLSTKQDNAVPSSSAKLKDTVIQIRRRRTKRACPSLCGNTSGPVVKHSRTKNSPSPYAHLSLAPSSLQCAPVNTALWTNLTELGKQSASPYTISDSSTKTIEDYSLKYHTQPTHPLSPHLNASPSHSSVRKMGRRTAQSLNIEAVTKTSAQSAPGHQSSYRQGATLKRVIPHLSMPGGTRTPTNWNTSHQPKSEITSEHLHGLLDSKNWESI